MTGYIDYSGDDGWDAADGERDEAATASAIAAAEAEGADELERAVEWWPVEEAEIGDDNPPY